MKYALGNMLNGAGGLNPDGLSLDLQFATDKTLTARKGPTPVFTRASSGRFVGSDGLIQSAGNNIARFDHDPITLACKGLLIEESRTNTLQRSEDFTQAIWTKTNVTVTGDNATSPDGSNTADSIFETAINSGHRVQYGTTITTGTYSASVYVKSVGGRNVNLEFVSGGAGAYANFNLQTAAVALSGVYGTGFTFISASITNAGNNWFRISLVATTPVSASQLLIQILDGNNNSYLGDVTKGVQLWGAQLEAGGFPTSYIPTTTASVIRSADVCDVIGADVHPSVGTLVVEFDRRTLNSVIFRSPGRVLASASATGADYVGIDHNDTQIRTPIRAANATVSTLAFNNTSIGTTKTAVAWSSGDSSHVSGGVVRISTSAAIAFANPLDTISFCGIAPNAICTTIARITYYKKRLPNAKLQSLTV